MKSFALATATLLCGVSLAAAQDRPRLFGKHKDRAGAPSVYGGQPPCDCPPGTSFAPGTPGMPGTPGAGMPGAGTPQSPMDPANPLNPNAQAPGAPPSSSFQEALASTGEGGTQPGSSYMPGFFGDFIGSTIIQATAVGLITAPNVTQGGGLKLVESDSPRPMDRIYYNYNYFGNVKVDEFNPGAPDLQLHRHVVGAEKTFLNGNASVGIRLPFFSQYGSFAYADGYTGDLTIISKFALLSNRQNGNIVSAGVAVTVPSGGQPVLLGVEQPRSFGVIVQPFAGYIYNPRPRLYFHGFHSVAIPTDSNEPLFMSNGVGLGYWLYQNPNDGIIRGFVPTFEVHVNTPFTHREAVPPFVGQTFVRDSVNLTTGASIVMPRAVLGGAIGVPVAYGPNRIEALATVQLRY